MNSALGGQPVVPSDRQCKAIMTIASSSKCPSDAWMHAAAPMLMQPRMTLINVGANKGFHVNTFLQIFQSDWKVSNAAWHEALFAAPSLSSLSASTACPIVHNKRVRYAADKYSCCPRENQWNPVHAPWIPCMCGLCGDCLDTLPSSSMAPGSAQVTVVAVEMMRATANLLNQTFNRLGVSGHVVHGAAAERSAVVRTVPALAGTEHIGLGTRYFTAASGFKRNETVRQFTVDGLMKPMRHERIHMLSIDAEGFDALVLRGAKATLRRTKVIEFEFSGVGAWSRIGNEGKGPGEELWRVVDWLASTFGFRCWWIGGSRTPRLAPIVQHCTADMGKGFWSNVLCAHEPRLLAVLDAMVPPDLRNLTASSPYG